MEKNTPKPSISSLKSMVKKIFEAMKESQLLYSGKHIMMFAVFSSETMNARRQWNNIFSVLKRGGTCQPTIFYSAKNILQKDNKIKTFPDIQKLVCKNSTVKR